MEGKLTHQHRELLQQVALDSILHGLAEGSSLPLSLEDFPTELREEGAVFVTLRRGGQLRGCIGSMVARRPLVEDVAENAYAAAFRDPRFPSLTEEELEGLALHISLLTPPVAIQVRDRQELLAALEPGRHGVLIEDPPRRATFLPQVWEVLPDPTEFLGELFRKAGLPKDHWSDSLRVSLYEAVEI